MLTNSDAAICWLVQPSRTVLHDVQLAPGEAVRSGAPARCGYPDAAGAAGEPAAACSDRAPHASDDCAARANSARARTGSPAAAAARPDDTADTTPQTAPPSAAGMDPALLQRLIAQLTTTAAPQAAPQPSASSHDGRGFLSLLGEALGGGQTYGSTAEREQGGLSAAQAMGLRMMAASDYSYQPHTLGSIVAQGALGARESLGQTQAVSAARAAAAYDQQRQGQQDQLARIKEAISAADVARSAGGRRQRGADRAGRERWRRREHRHGGRWRLG